MNRGKRVTGILRKAWLLALAAMFTLLAAPAFALGLGQLTVKSQRGQPLLAEIAIISSDPAELENLQARLASPETFARIGLEPPTGAVTGLQFTVALDPRGNPVIRVTSQEPVDESLLTFLLEVDWGQGRLVREYSALLDAPRTVSAPAQPPIEAPTVAPSNAIVREPEPAPVAAPAQPAAEAAPETPAPATPEVAAQPPEASPPSNAVAPTPAPSPPAAPERTAQPVAATPGEYGPVKVGDTLGKIARTVDPDGHSLDQVMLALLRANPDAFIKGNINLVKAGAVLRAPTSSELSQYSASEARAIVHEQVGQWREMRKPAEQPVAVAATDAAPAAAAAGAAGKPQVADARLEIVPPSGKDARQAGTRSGIQAGGEGEMVELQQTKETLAARDAEVQELKTRVAELEKLQHEQQQLISMKDDKLAQAQQALAARQAAASTQAQPATPAQDKAAAWPWAVGGLVVVLALAWLFLRRRADRPAKPVFDTSRLAASVPARAPKAAAEPRKPDAAVAPTWHAGTPPQAPRSGETGTPEAASGKDDGNGAAAVSSSASNSGSAGHERIELARAYIDLGDVDTARGLLQEVADGGDAAARGEAARLLRDLV